MQIFPAGAQSSRDRMHWRHCFFPLWPCRVNKQSWPIRDGGIWIGTCKKGWVIKFQYTHSKFPPKCYFISKFNSPTGSDQPGKGSFTSSKMSWLQTKCLFNNLFTFFLSYLHLKSNLYGQSFAFSTQKSRALEWRGPGFFHIQTLGSIGDQKQLDLRNGWSDRKMPS